MSAPWLGAFTGAMIAPRGRSAWSACRRAVAAALLPILMSAGSAGAAAPAPGQPAPALKLTDMNGAVVALEAYRGRVVLLHFWATWCPHCRAEMPLLDQAMRAHPERLVVLGVNLAEKRRKVAAYVAETGITFPILLDPRGRAAAAFEVLSLPTTVIIDPDGRVQGTIAMGSMTREEIEATLARLGKPRPSP